VAGRTRLPDFEAILAGARQPDHEGADPATALLLDAAGELIGVYGLRRWTREDVAERSGLGRATVYRRFEGRDALIRAALERQAQRFFRAVTEAVAPLERIEDKVVDGFMVGLRLVRQSVLPSLIRHDPVAAMSLLTSEPLLRSARQALADGYEGLLGLRLRGPARRQAELVAEALVRLGLSFVLIPDSLVDLDDERAARPALRAVIGPILGGTPERA
jgi:AcrR family transcriptional regulator